MQLLWRFADFARDVRRRMRFGDLSRAQLRLLRLQWRSNLVECDWVVRPADPWDTDLPRHVSQENESVQALQDAIAIRELLFSELPEAQSAQLRAFRKSAAGELELIITGAVTRNGQLPGNVASAAMRAKLLGFQFWLEDGILETLESQECQMSF